MDSTITRQKLSDLIEHELVNLGLPREPALIYDPVRYTLSLGGKRIRPYFVLAGCGICGGNIEEAVPAALAIELLHNFTLLHDDIMDVAETRRGKPSVYKKWDSSTAILSGDVMFAWAFEQLQYYAREKTYSKGQYAAVIDIFLESAETVCEGQAYDLEYAVRKDVSIEEYLKMIRGKTAALISGSFMLGGAVADAGDDNLDAMRNLGIAVGTAFQIQDDLLDVIADPSKFGKRKGGDIKEGKKTYLSILALQRGDREQKSFLDNILSQQEVTSNQISDVIDIYQSLGVVEETRDTIETYYKKAVDILQAFPDSDYKTDLLNYLIKLKKREF